MSIITVILKHVYNTTIILTVQHYRKKHEGKWTVINTNLVLYIKSCVTIIFVYSGSAHSPFHQLISPCTKKSAKSSLTCMWRSSEFVFSQDINKHSLFEGCLTVHLPHEIKWNTNLMQLGNFIDVFLARHVSSTYVHHGTIRTVHTTFAAALKTITHPKTRCRKPYAATQHLMLLMMDICTRDMSS